MSWTICSSGCPPLTTRSRQLPSGRQSPSCSAFTHGCASATDIAEAVLLSAPAVVHTQGLGQLAVGQEHYLRWQLLGIVVGDDRAIEDLVDRGAAKAAGSGGTAADVVDLARRYLTGWRPELDGLSESSQSSARRRTAPT
jgi:hypothetical protein